MGEKGKKEGGKEGLRERKRGGLVGKNFLYRGRKQDLLICNLYAQREKK